MAGGCPASGGSVHRLTLKTPDSHNTPHLPAGSCGGGWPSPSRLPHTICQGATREGRTREGPQGHAYGPADCTYLNGFRGPGAPHAHQTSCPEEQRGWKVPGCPSPQASGLTPWCCPYPAGKLLREGTQVTPRPLAPRPREGASPGLCRPGLPTALPTCVLASSLRSASPPQEAEHMSSVCCWPPYLRQNKGVELPCLRAASTSQPCLAQWPPLSITFPTSAWLPWEVSDPGKQPAGAQVSSQPGQPSPGSSAPVSRPL